MVNMKKLSNYYDSYVKPYKKEVDTINSMLESGWYIGKGREILLKRKYHLFLKIDVKNFIELHKNDKLFTEKLGGKN